MKLFIRDHLLLIVVYVVQLCIISSVYWLDGFHHFTICLYAAILSSGVFILYLIYRYISNRSFYSRLERPLESLDDLKAEVQHTPLADGLQQLLKSQYRHYKTEIHHYKYRLEDHIQFINQWVHQMKTPVSVIHLMVQEEDDPRFTAIGDELDRIKKGLDMVLYTARLDTFERDFCVETFNLEAVVRSATSSQKRLFIRNRVFPSIQIKHDLEVASDEKWLLFVLNQLITNAIRYTVEENSKIIFRGYLKGMKTVLEIKDEGVGIQASDLPRVFDPYFTGENGRAFQESTGMGLYLVKQICEKLGHQVEIESTLNVGTTVRMIF